MTLPLDGVRVIEVGQALAGPLAGVLLADMGADVIKIEKPDGGDDARIWGPPFGPDGVTSLYFYSQNRNKRSVALDLKSAADVEKLNRLCETADILIQNLRPGVVDEIGIGPEAMLKRHPRLIYCSIWAFGYQGPMRLKPGFDPLLQAYGAMMTVTGRPEDPPTFCGASINDKATGMFCTIGALAALRMRDKTGKGCLVDTSLFNSAVHWVEGSVNAYLADGTVPKRHGTGGAVIVPYQLFETADRPVCLAPGNDRLWARCAQVLGHPEWAHRSALRQERGPGAQQGRAAAADRRRHARQDARRVAGGFREGGRAVQPGERHRRAGRDRRSSRRSTWCISCRAAGRRWWGCRSPSTISGRARRGRRRSSASIRMRCWVPLEVTSALSRVFRGPHCWGRATPVARSWSSRTASVRLAHASRASRDARGPMSMKDAPLEWRAPSEDRTPSPLSQRMGGAYCRPPSVHSLLIPRSILSGLPMPRFRSKASP